MDSIAKSNQTCAIPSTLFLVHSGWVSSLLYLHQPWKTIQARSNRKDSILHLPISLERYPKDSFGARSSMICCFCSFQIWIYFVSSFLIEIFSWDLICSSLWFCCPCAWNCHFSVCSCRVDLIDLDLVTMIRLFYLNQERSRSVNCSMICLMLQFVCHSSR